MVNRSQGKLDSGFVAKSEPSQILEGIELGGRVAVITGGYSGIGLETTRALVERGVKAYVPARDLDKANRALADLNGEVVIAAMDLGDLASVESFAAQVSAEEDRLDLLINNAGIMACPETRIGSGWEAQFATNHLGHFVLTRGLLGSLREATGARVICLSSSGHKRSDIIWDDIHFEQHAYEKWTAYGQAKTANALFALGLDLHYADEGVKALSVHPGGILTPLQRHLATEEMTALGWTDEHGELTEQAAAIFKTPAQGATTTLWAATSAQLSDRGGVYCEDCDIADPQDNAPLPYLGVAPWATNENSAQRLWELTEHMLS